VTYKKWQLRGNLGDAFRTYTSIDCLRELTPKSFGDLFTVDRLNLTYPLEIKAFLHLCLNCPTSVCRDIAR